MTIEIPVFHPREASVLKDKEPYGVTFYDHFGQAHDAIVEPLQQVIYFDHAPDQSATFSDDIFPIIEILLSKPNFHNSKDLMPQIPKKMGWAGFQEELESKLGAFIGIKKDQGHSRLIRFRQEPSASESYTTYDTLGRELSQAIVLSEEQAVIVDGVRLLFSPVGFEVASCMFNNAKVTRDYLRREFVHLTDRQIQQGLGEVKKNLKTIVQIGGVPGSKGTHYHIITHPTEIEQAGVETHAITTNGKNALVKLDSNKKKLQISVEGDVQEFDLSHQELMILEFLLTHDGSYRTKEIEEGIEGSVNAKIISNHFARVKAKLGDLGGLIEQVGVGSGMEYRFRTVKSLRDDVVIKAAIYKNGDQSSLSIQLTSSNRVLRIVNQETGQISNHQLSRREYDMVRLLVDHDSKDKLFKSEIAKHFTDLDESDVHNTLRILRTKEIDIFDSIIDGYYNRYSIDARNIQVYKPFEEQEKVKGLRNKFRINIESRGRIPLTKEAEFELGHHVQNGFIAKKALEEDEDRFGSFDLVLFNGESIVNVKKSDLEFLVELGSTAREIFVMSNRSLAYHIMMSYYPNAVKDLGDEAVQAGLMALDRAVRKFDPRKGFKFSVYAKTWIRSFLQREYGRHNRKRDYEQATLDAPVTHDSTTTRHEFVPDESANYAFENKITQITSEQRMEKLYLMFNEVELTDEETSCLIQRGIQEKDFYEIGADHGFSRGTAENRFYSAVAKFTQRFGSQEVLEALEMI